MKDVLKKIKRVVSKHGLFGTQRIFCRVVRYEGLSGILRRFNSHNIIPASALISVNISNAYISSIIETAHRPQDHNLEYVPLAKNFVDTNNFDLRLIAFYLPQFHPFPENDKWWGKGFTEWTNVSKAVPLFLGHYQPHLPAELGFYDLRVIDVMYRQVELAKQYGVYGFCFHYYWFSGKRLLELPLNNFIKNNINFPFCICWANENWTRRWDGDENDILISQKHEKGDDLKFIQDIEETLKDSRYIKVNGRPVIVVYRVSLLPDPVNTVKIWRNYCREHDVGELYLVAAQSFGISDPTIYGFDAAVEFPPHGLKSTSECPLNQIELTAVAPLTGAVYDYDDMAMSNMKNFNIQHDSSYKVFKTVSPGWDNTARKNKAGHVFHGATPLKYANWLSKAIKHTLSNQEGDERLVFINAWNEWGEGAHLEPDRRFGYGYLHATASVLCSYIPIIKSVSKLIDDIQLNFVKKSKIVVVVHLYYEALLDEIAAAIANCGHDVDVFLTVTKQISENCILEIKKQIKNPYVIVVENRGRDILPFMIAYRRLEQFGYEYGCKIHSKSSPQRADGDAWRKSLFKALLTKNRVERALFLFRQRDKLGVIAAPNTLIDLSANEDVYILNVKWLNYLFTELHVDHLVNNYRTSFPAGSMYWFRVEALKYMSKMEWLESKFEIEVGQIDGTLAHAMERMVSEIASVSGYCSIEMDDL